MANALSTVRLLAVPLENDYIHTLYFANESAQTAYFANEAITQTTNVTYLRKDKVIRYPAHFDALLGVNYIMYQNQPYTTKWYYAFVTKMEYIDDGRTDIYIETDVIQTWLFDYTLKTSFVEREHTADDTIGANTYPENIETGDYVCNQHYTDSNMDSLLSDLCYIMGSSCTPEATSAIDSATGGDLYNGIYSGVKYYRYDDVTAIDVVLNIYAENAKTDSITGLFMIPKWLAPLNTSATWREVLSSYQPTSYNLVIDKPSTINGYTPRNNKLFCYPYHYMTVSNNNGGSAIYRFEKFATGTDTCLFIVQGALTAGGSIRLTPLGYNGIPRNDEEGLNLGKFPICNFTADMYTNWLTQNSVNIALSVGTDALKIVGGIGATLVSGGVGGLVGGGAAALSGVHGIASTIANINQQSMTPPQARGNTNCGDVVTAAGTNTFHFYKMSIKQEYAKIIDGFFDMFGYATNRVKVPNVAKRQNYWFTKTLDANIDANIPVDDLAKIKNCYNRGITFWRNPANIGNYSVSNNIVS